MSSAPFRILHLDGDAAHRAFVADALGRAADPLLLQAPAATADLAALASSGRFDAVLVGDAAELARVQEALPDVPVVVHSGGASLASAVRVLEAAARGARETKREASASRETRASRAAVVADVSSAVRPSIAALIDMTTLLLDGPLADDQREFVKTIRAGGEHVLTTLHDIADFEKIESGEFELARGPFSVRACIEEAIALVASQTGEDETEIVYAIAPSTPAVILGDAGRTRRILVELVTRARMAVRRGTVRLSVSATPLPDDRCEVEVSLECARDGGAPVPDELPDLSESGQLLQIMGGTVGLARSESGLRGALTLTAPVVEREERALASSALGILGRKRVLLVDDHAFGREVLGTLFRSWNMEPVEAETARVALDLASQGDKLDLAIIDYLMPEMDGVELARALKRHERAHDVPIVLMTTVAGIHAARERARGVFAAFLAKPIRPSQLFNVVHDVLQRAAASAPRRTSERLPGAAFDASLGRTHPLRLLVAEDNVTNQRVLKAMLERLGYSARFVTDGLAAVETAIAESFDAVFMDIQMPELDGFEACRRICARLPKEIRPRLVAMTAEALEEDRAAAIAAGIEDYVRKPITREALVTALAACRPLERGGGS